MNGLHSRMRKGRGQETRMEGCCEKNCGRGLDGLVLVVKLLAGWLVLLIYL